MRILASALIFVATLPALFAQSRVPVPPTNVPQAPSIGRPQEVSVTLSGCLSGKHLRLSGGAGNDATLDLLHTSEFVLEGSRDLVQMLAHDHDGHEETITGFAVIPPSLIDERVQTKTATRGRTTVVAGVRESSDSLSGASPGPVDTKVPMRLKVQSATHVAEKCAVRR